MKKKSSLKTISLILTLLILNITVKIIFATPNAASALLESVVGEKDGTYLVLINEWSQPGTYYEETEKLTYQIRRIKDNKILETHFISHITHTIINGPEEEIVHARNEDLPIQLSEWDPVDPVEDYLWEVREGVPRFRTFQGEWISTGVKVANSNGHNNFNTEYAYRGRQAVYLITGEGMISFDIGGASLVVAIPREALDDFFYQDQNRIYDIMPQILTRLKGFGREKTPVRPIYPLGWSPRGALACIKTEKDAKSKNTHPMELQITDLVSDKTVPIAGFMGRLEKKKTFYEIVAGAPWKENTLQELNIRSTRRLDFEANPLHGKLIISIDAQEQGTEPLSRYSLSAVIYGKGQKIINSWESSPGEKTQLLDLKVAGTIKSPYEERVAVVLARWWRNGKTKEEWIDFSLVGCHLNAGFELVGKTVSREPTFTSPGESRFVVFGPGGENPSLYAVTYRKGKEVELNQIPESDSISGRVQVCPDAAYFLRYIDELGGSAKELVAEDDPAIHRYNIYRYDWQSRETSFLHDSGTTLGFPYNYNVYRETYSFIEEDKLFISSLKDTSLQAEISLKENLQVISRSADRRHLLLSNSMASGQYRLYIFDHETRSMIPVEGVSQRESYSLSPGGEFIAATHPLDQGYAFRTYSSGSQTWQDHYAAEFIPQGIKSPAENIWSPRGEWVLLLHSDSTEPWNLGLYCCSAITGEIKTLLTPEAVNGWITSVSWQPNGQIILNLGNEDFQILDPETGVVTALEFPVKGCYEFAYDMPYHSFPFG